jgi:small redox-active disulfide protein 2
MKVEIIGPGCPFCKKLYRRVNEAVQERGFDADVQHITDWRTSLRYFPRTPVLIVDGEIRHRGKILPNRERIIEILSGG